MPLTFTRMGLCCTLPARSARALPGLLVQDPDGLSSGAVWALASSCVGKAMKPLTMLRRRWVVHLAEGLREGEAGWQSPGGSVGATSRPRMCVATCGHLARHGANLQISLAGSWGEYSFWSMRMASPRAEAHSPESSPTSLHGPAQLGAPSCQPVCSLALMRKPDGLLFPGPALGRD
eukprot:4135196-Amphidinium_carterae.1